MHVSTSVLSDYVDTTSLVLPPSGETTPRRFIINQAGDVSVILSTSDVNKVKELLRSQFWPVNHDVRRVLWSEISQCFLGETNDIYKETVTQMYDSKSTELMLPDFVDPSHQINYHLNSEGKNTVLKILGVLAEVSPDITYCPTVYAITSALLHYSKEQDVYRCISGLLKKRFLSQTKHSYIVSSMVLRDLAKKFAKSTYSYMLHNSKQIDHIFYNWIWWIWRDLPFSYVVKIMDCFLFEGPKVLYRVALAILILFNKTDKMSTSGDIPDAITHLCENMPLSEEKLIKMAYGIRAFSRKDIDRLVFKNEMELSSRNRVPTMLHSASNEDLHHDHLTITPTMNGMAVSVNTCNSDVLSHKELQAVWGWLPRRMTIYQPILLFSTEEHGTSILTLYSKISGHTATILVIKTMDNEVFGAFCASDWAERHQHGNFLTYFGTGETFIFSIFPHRRKYEWVGLSNHDVSLTGQMFMAGDNTSLTIGGGNGEGLRLDSDLYNGLSKHCDTFDNEPLYSSEYFKAKIVEVYGFE